MSDVGEHIVTEPDEDEVASAALQRSKFGVTSEVVALYAICLFVALAIAAICVAATGGSWTNVYTAILDGSVRRPVAGVSPSACRRRSCSSRSAPSSTVAPGWSTSARRASS